MVRLYGMPNCSKCVAAKEKLERLDVAYEVHDYKYHVSWHDGWSQDGSVEVMAARAFYGETAVPLLQVDGVVMDYPSAMRHLKKLRSA